MSKVEQVLSRGEDVNALVDDEGSTILMIAAGEGRATMIRVLLDHGADVNAKVKTTGTTALILAAGHGSLEAVRILLQRGADVHVRESHGRTALMEAAGLGGDSDDPTSVVELLLESGATVQGADGAALAFASEHGNARLVKILIQKGADVDSEWEHSTPLMRATKKDNIGLIRLLIKENADVKGEGGGDMHCSLRSQKTILLLRSCYWKEGRM